jgi:hypothetical protein
MPGIVANLLLQQGVDAHVTVVSGLGHNIMIQPKSWYTGKPEIEIESRYTGIHISEMPTIRPLRGSKSVSRVSERRHASHFRRARTAIHPQLSYLPTGTRWHK